MKDGSLAVLVQFSVAQKGLLREVGGRVGVTELFREISLKLAPMGEEQGLQILFQLLSSRNAESFSRVDPPSSALRSSQVTLDRLRMIRNYRLYTAPQQEGHQRPAFG